MHRAVLPQRPLRLRLRHVTGTLVASLVVLAMAALCGYFAYEEYADIGVLRETSRTWDAGVPAVDGSIHGKRRSKLALSWLLASYDLDVEYTDAGGVRHTGSRSFWTVLGGPDTDDGAELRYDPKDPARFVSSWEHDASGARWRAVVVLGALFTVLSLAMLLAIPLIASSARAVARCGRHGDEVRLRVVSTQMTQNDKGEPNGCRYEFELDGKTLSESFKLTERPLFHDVAQQYAFALRHGEKIQVLRSDLYPYAVRDEELRGVIARMSAPPG